MNLTDLSGKELLLLCRRAERECARRMRELAASLADDGRTRELLQRLARDEEGHEERIAEVDRRTPGPRVWRVDERALARLLAIFFPPSPPASEALDEARRLEEQSVDFYRALAEVSPDSALSAFFNEMAELEEGHLSDVW